MQLRKCWAHRLDYGTQIFKLKIAGQAPATKPFEGKLRQGAGFWFRFCLICTVWGKSRRLAPPLPPDLHGAGIELGIHLTVHFWAVIPLSLLQTRGRGGGGGRLEAALPQQEGSPGRGGGLVKSGGGKFHLRSGFLQTRCRALGIEAMFLSSAGKWSWGWRGGAEQAPRSNLGKEKKESEANRNRTVPVCRCNLTWLSPLSAKGGTWC